MLKKYIGIAVPALLLLSPAANAQVESCVEKKLSAFEQREPFSIEGEVTCPQADIVGLSPRERRHNRSDIVCYTAATGRHIVSESADSIKVENVSDNDGRIGTLSVEGDETKACVPISCVGAGIGQGRRWQKVKLSGHTAQEPSKKQIIQWTMECGRS